MTSLFHNKGFLIVILTLVVVSLSCSLPVAAPQAVSTQGPQETVTDTSQPPAVATNTAELPTNTAEPTQENTPSGGSVLPQADFGGVTFAYDPQIASSVSGEEVPAVNEGQGAPWEVQPVTIKFSFDGYPVPDSFTAPEIQIFPVKDFQSMSDVAAKIIDDLRQVIAVHPPASGKKEFPFLPVWNAAQIMHTKVAYFTFANGQGVRYLAMNAQNIAPINNKYLFYTYQGLTSDGKYYISAVLPVTNAILPPDDSTIPGGDFQKFSDTFPTYIAAMQDKLDAQSDDAFVPSLTALDNMIKSMTINK
jgi:hypothetical protein